MTTPTGWPLPISAEAVLRQTIRNCAVAATSKRVRAWPRWAIVSRITANGSGYSADLCRWAGLDPDELVSPRKLNK